MDDNKGKEFLSKDFLKKIVDGEKQIKHLCRDCNNMPICMVARAASSTFENVGVAQTVVACPHYVSHDEIDKLDKLDKDNDKDEGDSEEK